MTPLAGVNGKHPVPQPDTEQKAAKALTGPPLAVGYRPSLPVATLGSWGQDGRILPLSRVWADIERMLVHPSVASPYAYYRSGVSSAAFEATEASSPKAGDFAVKCFERLWLRGLEQMLNCYDYGWAGFETAYVEEKGLLTFDRFAADFHPLDCWALEKRGDYAGFAVRGDWYGDGPATDDDRRYQAGGVTLWGPQKWPAKGLWLTHNRRYDRFYGRTQLLGAWRPWLRLATRDGAEEVLDLAFFRHGVGPTVVRHPVKAYKRGDGSTSYDGARDYARDLADSFKSGASVTLPNTKDPETGEYDWSVEAPTTTLNAEGIISYVGTLEKQISVGVGVPPELLEASETGSGWSGRKVPLVAFFTQQVQNARSLVRECYEQIVGPLLKWNFGDDAHAEVNVKLVLPAGLAEEKEKGGGGPKEAAQGGEDPLAALLGGGGAGEDQGGGEGLAAPGEDGGGAGGLVGLSAADGPCAAAMAPEPPEAPPGRKDVFLAAWRNRPGATATLLPGGVLAVEAVLPADDPDAARLLACEPSPRDALFARVLEETGACSPASELSLIELNATRAPKGGVTISGKDYVGGEFIPSAVARSAAGLEAVAAAKAAKKGGPAKAGDGSGKSPPAETAPGGAEKKKYVGAAVGAAVHKHAEAVKLRVAEAVGGVPEEMTEDAGQKDKKPYDVKIPGGHGGKDHDIEVKSMSVGSKKEISVHADALARKVDHAARTGCLFHTVVCDERETYGGGANKANYSGHNLYYKRGSGRYSLSKMYKVKDAEELKRLIATPDDQLPEAARGSLPPPPPLEELRAAAAKAAESRKAKDAAYKAANKDRLREQAAARRKAGAATEG